MNMHISWAFLDKRAAVIDAIRKQKDMDFIIENTPDNIREQKMLLISPKSVRLTGLPFLHNPKGTEQRIAAMLDDIDMLLVRYEKALEYKEWFHPAWNELTDNDRTILSEIYQSGSMRSGAIARLVKMLGYSSSHIDRLRSKALDRLTLLLYGL